jgi:hypothetical protein
MGNQISSQHDRATGAQMVSPDAKGSGNLYSRTTALAFQAPPHHESGKMLAFTGHFAHCQS